MNNRIVKNLSIYLTTNCNLICKNCCAETSEKYNITLKEVDNIVNNIGEVDSIYFTGGEPTTHPKFKTITEKIKQIKSKHLILATNGFNLIKHIDVLGNFTQIFISDYKHNINNDSIDQIKSKYPHLRIVVQSSEFKKLEGKMNKCPRGSGPTVAYKKNKIYGCCVAPGIKDSKGIKFDENWKTNSIDLPVPCNNCVFAI